MFYGFKKNPVDRGAARDFGTTTEETTHLDLRPDTGDITAAERTLSRHQFSVRQSGDSVLSVSKTFYRVSPAKGLTENCKNFRDLSPEKVDGEGLSLCTESYTLERDTEMSCGAAAFVLTFEHFQAMIERITQPGKIETAEPSAALSPSRRSDRA